MQGMKLSIRSKQASKRRKEEWYQGGLNIQYQNSPYQNELIELNPSSKLKTFFCLSFEYKFDFDNDEVFFAYTVPYTYSQLQYHIKEIYLLHNINRLNIMKTQILGKSLGHLDIPIIKITNQNKKDKQIVMIIGRQHSGETHSSFIIHGLINFLLSNTILANNMRDIIEFWIVPMANPDGVVIGNYRCNLQGKDMNRCFYPDTHFYKSKKVNEVQLISNYIKSHSDQENLKLFLDIHTHSSQRSIFIYAPGTTVEDDFYIRQFPQILDETSTYFRLQSCKFQSEKAKRNCARLAILRDFQLQQSYTIEASSYGYFDKRTNTTIQFNENNLLKFGNELCIAIAKYFQIDQELIQTQEGLKIDLDYGLLQIKKKFIPKKNNNTKSKIKRLVFKNTGLSLQNSCERTPTFQESEEIEKINERKFSCNGKEPYPIKWNLLKIFQDQAQFNDNIEKSSQLQSFENLSQNQFAITTQFKNNKTVLKNREISFGVTTLKENKRYVKQRRNQLPLYNSQTTSPKYLNFYEPNVHTIEGINVFLSTQKAIPLGQEKQQHPTQQHNNLDKNKNIHNSEQRSIEFKQYVEKALQQCKEKNKFAFSYDNIDMQQRLQQNKNENESLIKKQKSKKFLKYFTQLINKESKSNKTHNQSDIKDFKNFTITSHKTNTVQPVITLPDLNNDEDLMNRTQAKRENEGINLPNIITTQEKDQIDMISQSKDNIRKFKLNHNENLEVLNQTKHLAIYKQYLRP